MMRRAGMHATKYAAQSSGPRWLNQGFFEQRGTVTAELAVVFPVVTLLLGLLAFGAQLGLTQLRFEAAAHASARQAARGESDALLVGQQIAGAGADVSLSSSDGFSTISVSGLVDGALASWLSLRLTAKAIAKTEDLDPSDAP